MPTRKVYRIVGARLLTELNQLVCRDYCFVLSMSSFGFRMLWKLNNSLDFSSGTRTRLMKSLRFSIIWLVAKLHAEWFMILVIFAKVSPPFRSPKVWLRVLLCTLGTLLDWFQKVIKLEQLAGLLQGGIIALRKIFENFEHLMKD